MKKFNNKKVKFQVLMIFLIVLILILLIFLNILRTQESKYELKSVHDLSNVLKITNSVSDVYDGNVEHYKISEKVTNLFEIYLPSISEEIIQKDSNGLEEYFYKDEERIKLNIGITDKDEFITFAQKLQELECKLDQCEQVTYLKDSYEVSETSESIKLNIVYDNGKSLNCKLTIIGETNVTMKFELI